jgi:hypothetical protein
MPWSFFISDPNRTAALDAAAVVFVTTSTAAYTTAVAAAAAPLCWQLDWS